MQNICFLIPVPIIPEFLYTIRHQHMNQSQMAEAAATWY